MVYHWEDEFIIYRSKTTAERESLKLAQEKYNKYSEDYKKKYPLSDFRKITGQFPIERDVR